MKDITKDVKSVEAFICIECKKKEATYYVFCSPKCEEVFDKKLAETIMKKIKAAMEQLKNGNQSNTL